MPASRPALILHAGAGSYPKDSKRIRRIQKKLREICGEGYRYLKRHSALDTVVEVVRWLEDWPETNAGTGAMLQSDGSARLSASLMDGERMRFSAVINTEDIKNPILVAKLLQKEKDRVLSDQGARRFAIEHGFELVDTRTKESLKRWRKMAEGGRREKYGTVGACALDREGRLASATSTGGKGLERVGRVSDSAMPAGTFANQFAAASATGLGEDIVEEALASTLAIRAADWMNLGRSFTETFRALKKKKRRLAAIGVDRQGNVAWSHTTGILYYAYGTGSKSASLDHT